MPASAVLIGLVVVVVSGAVLLRWAHVSSRNRKQLMALASRVAELEERLSQVSGAWEPVDATIPQDTAAAPGATDDLTADALAGWTSHVGRILTRESMPTSLAEQAVVAAYRRIEDPIRPSDLADELAVSLRSLQRGLMASLDCSPSDLILTVKMREARRMIESGQFRVGEVAHRLGFADAAHFSRRYRRFYRCPPSEHAGAAP